MVPPDGAATTTPTRYEAEPSPADTGPDRLLLTCAFKLLSRPAPPELFHYTDQRGYLGILQHKTIWATDVRYLNDSAEFKMGLRLVKAAVEEYDTQQNSSYLEKLSTIFGSAAPETDTVGVRVACFSTVADSLSQWRAYSRGSGGLALGFNGPRLRTALAGGGATLCQVIYDEADQRALINEFVAEAIASVNEGLIEPVIRRLYLSLLILCSVIKHRAFHGEAEWRAIAWAGPGRKLHARPGRSFLLPYAEVALDMASQGGSRTKIEKIDALESVWIGPTAEAQAAEVAARLHLSSIDRDDVVVKRSDVPFRDW